LDYVISQNIYVISTIKRLMHKVYKFRLYPTKAQTTTLERTLELCRMTFNETLAYRKDMYEQEHVTVSNYESHNLLPQWKKEYPDLKNVFSQTLQEVQERVDLAYRNFFHRVKNGEKPGYPRFKGRGWYDSFTYPQMGFKLNDNKLYLGKIGMVYMVKHREVEGNVKRVTIRRKNNKWHACLTVEGEYHIIPTENKQTVGIDMGLTSFATLSNGEKMPNPRFFRLEEKTLAKVQRRLSRCEKGTPERTKARKVVARVHERIGNRRYDFIHQLSHSLVNKYGLICFEDLNIKGMVNNHRLAKSISDAAWNMLIIVTKYKAESAGTKVVMVNPANTSKMCSRCGLLVEKELKDRTHKCPSCGLVLDRDENAAINILRLGLQSVGQEP
jgi:putative transposase